MTLFDTISGPDGDLLSLRRILGGGRPGEGSAEERRQMLTMFSTTEALREGLERRRAEGYRAMLMMGESRLFEAMGSKPDEALPQALPIVPNLQGFMREAVEFGMLGAGLRRAWRVGPMALAGLGLRSIGRAPDLLKRDFPTMLRSFIELELADFIRYRPPVIFLQAQITDLALCMHNPRILEAFFSAVANRTDAEAGLMTQNFGQLMGALNSWGFEAHAVVAPWGANGAGMRPNPEACLTAMKAAHIPVWADRSGLIDAPGTHERTAMERAGLVGSVRDDLTIWGRS